MLSGQDLLVHRERHRELLRESERWHRLRWNSDVGGVSSGSGMSERGIDVRWAKDGDVAAISAIIQMNGRPMWEAFEERFVVAEEDGRLLAAASYISCGAYGNAVEEIRVGEVVVDPWGGERELAVALYRGMVRLAKDTRASEVRVANAKNVEYLVAAGYSHGLRGWTAKVDGGKPVRPSFGKRVGQAFGRTAVPGV